MRIGFEVFNIEFNCSRATTSRALEQIRVVYSRGFAFLLCMVSFTAQGKAGDAEEFKSFISSPPTISKLIYSHYYPGRTEKYPPTFSFVEWQPTAFLRIISTNLAEVTPPFPKNLRKAEIECRYGNFWWQAECSASVLTVWDSASVPDYPDNPVFSAVSQSLRDFSYLMNFGVEHADIGMIRWNGNSFVCTNVINGDKWLLNGQLLVDQEGRAKSVELDLTLRAKNFTVPRNGKWEIDYSYEKPLALDFLPNRITTLWVEGKEKSVLDEYNIIDIETGSAAATDSAFKPGKFVSIPRYTVFVVTNNAVEYYANGAWQAKWKPNDPRIIKPNDRHVQHARLVYVAFAVLLFSPLGFLLRKGKGVG